jgi:NitT/TauT family transport system substrate-binding protein
VENWLRLIVAAGSLQLAVGGNGAEAKQLRLGHFPNLTHAQATYARAGGQLEKVVGVPIKWTSFNAGPSAIEAIFADAIDATFIGPNPAINGFLKSRGKKFVIVAGAASGGAGLVVRKDAGIRSEGDFNGKTIATPQLGNTQDVAARLWFLEKGYKLKERGGRLALLPLANPDQLTMFQKREIDGAWTVEPWVSRLELEGGGELFLDEKTRWPQGRYVTTHLIVNKQFLAGNRDLVKRLLRGHVAITQEINRDKQAAGKVLNQELKKETGQTLREEVVTRAMSRVEYTWDPIPSSLHRSAEAAHRAGFLKSKPDLKGIYDLGPLNEVLGEMNLAPVVQ